MHKYHDPKNVKSPKDCITDIQVIFDGMTNPNYSIAKIKWCGKTKIAIRYNVNQQEWNNPNKENGNILSIGEPNSRGYATWFVLPYDFLQNLINDNCGFIEELKETLEIIETENIQLNK